MRAAHSSWFGFFRKATVIMIAGCGLCIGVHAADQAPPAMPYWPIPPLSHLPQAELPANTMLPPVSREAKRLWAQLFMLVNPIGIRDLLNFIGHKMPAKCQRQPETRLNLAV